MVENVCQKYHRIYLEDFIFTGRSKNLQEKPSEIQFNSQDVFRCLPLTKESWSRYIKFSKSENQEQKDHPETDKQGTIYEAQQDMSYSSRRDALRIQTHKKRDGN